MKRAHLLTGCAAALALSGLLAACDDGPTQPSRETSRPPGTAPVTTLRIEVRGPDTMAPGTTAQFSAFAHQSDGSTRDVTSVVEWRSGNHWVLTISATGLATTHDRGEAGIGAAFAGLTSWKSSVMVIPPGTYRLVGTVSDAGLSLAGARVEVTSGTGQGLFTLSGGAKYLLYGVAGEIEVRVTLDGYEEQRKRLQVAGHQVLDFNLALSRPRSEVAGTYTLTVTAAPECRAQLPEEARTRTFTAVVTQDGPRLVVALDRSQFVTTGVRTLNTFSGIVQPHRVTFRVNGYYEGFYLYLPDVLEQLSAPMLFSFSGLVGAAVSAAGVAGTLDGDIETLQSGLPSVRFQRTASCKSANHQFVLSR